jgi:KUP system potassium uptake protein
MSSAQTHTPEGTQSKRAFLSMALGSVGVVFGDIGTSPLYAMREALMHTKHFNELQVYGVVSLVLWALILVVTLKYVLFLMRADNRGEGGTLALMALAQQALGRRSLFIMLLGMAGAALFYGDAIITPAISVMGAIEGLNIAPGFGSTLAQYVTPLSVVILIALFLVQSRGTASMARWFGPITALWFLTLAGLGLYHISDAPRILFAINPYYAYAFFVENGFLGFIVLGSVFLAVTGAEALYADMGHFGRGPIRFAWIGMVLPSLALNYLGQGALVLADPAAIENPFYRMVPTAVFWPVIILATLAAIIAGQAVITGAFSVTQQAVQLGLLPRLAIKRTSETQAGQIYAPQVNAMMLVGVLLLVAMFDNSSALASAYGIAVTGTMLVSTLLGYIVIRHIWKWNMVMCMAFIIPMAAIDLVFLSSNLIKLFHGAWMPLAFGMVLMTIMTTWNKGTDIINAKAKRDSVPLDGLMTSLKARPPHRTPGTAIFLTSDPEAAPVALLHNLKHNKVLHEKNVILNVRTLEVPRVPDGCDRLEMTQLSEDFYRITLSYGFMETPNVPKALTACRKLGLKFDIMSTSFFLGRRSVVPSAHSGMPLWRDKLYIFMMRNAENPTDFFHIPAGRVVEMGMQVSV